MDRRSGTETRIPNDETSCHGKSKSARVKIFIGGVFVLCKGAGGRQSCVCDNLQAIYVLQYRFKSIFDTSKFILVDNKNEASGNGILW